MSVFRKDYSKMYQEIDELYDLAVEVDMSDEDLFDRMNDIYERHHYEEEADW